MPSYKSDNGSWYCQFYYTDYTGTRKKKLKRGFNLKRDADAWERDFLQRLAGSPGMTFGSLCDSYLEDIRIRCKAVTYRTRESRVRMWIRPYFENKPVNEITAGDIRLWQQTLSEGVTEHQKRLSEGYIDTITREMQLIFSYAQRFAGLVDNPCKKAGRLCGKKKQSLNFWTQTEFNSFIATFDKDSPFYAAFMTLYYTGMRVGELQALFKEDVDLKSNVIHVSKTHHVVHGEHIITTTKTEKSRRDIVIPEFLTEILAGYIQRLYRIGDGDRIFLMTPSAYGKQLDNHAKAAGVKKIRVHDLRHSHASLMIELGAPIQLVSERLGHEKVSTTLDIYTHLYPTQQPELARKLQQQYELLESK